MPTKLTRRDILKQMTLGVAIVAAGSVAKANTNEVQSQPFSNEVLEQLNKEDDVYLEGLVLKVEDNKMLIAYEHQLYALLVTEQTRLWKGKVTSLLETVLPNPKWDKLAKN